MSFRNVM